MEQLYRNNYSIYNYMFYIVYYGLIGKRCFATAVALHKLHGNCSTRSTALLWPHPAPRSCRRSSTLRSESGNRTYSITAKADDLRARFKVPEWGVFCHTARLRNSPAWLKLVLSDSAPIALNQHASCRHWNRFYNGITSNRHELINHIHSDADMVRYNT